MTIKKELKKFKKFKENYKFNQLKLTTVDDKIFCEGILIKDKNGFVGESDKWINVGYSLKGAYPKLLSNLFPYTFKFKGKKLASIESFFQSIKFKDKKLQNKIFKYSGKEALVLKETTDYDWKINKKVYFLGKEIERNSKKYDDLVDELYISALKNTFYRNAIKNCKLPIVHIMGEEDKNNTVFTRYEFEFMLNCLHDYLNQDKE